jgi:ribosomal protein S18 acetylase RimI-like enzyme
MSVRPLHRNDLEELFHVYCEVTRPVVHGFPPSLVEFSQAILGPPRHLNDSTVLVYDPGDGPVAFARLGRYSPIGQWSLAAEGHGLLLGPFFAAPHAAAAAALIDEAAALLRDRQAPLTHAFDPVEAAGVPFYNGGFCGTSERMPHIVQALENAGFRVRHREMCLTRPDTAVPAPDPPGRVRLHTDPRADSHWLAAAMEDGLEAGTCSYSRMHPQRSRQPEASKWGYVDGLGVHDTYQGRGIGRALLLHAIGHLRDMGCGPVCLTTGSENHRAQNLYFSTGFALVDSCLTLARPPW